MPVSTALGSSWEAGPVAGCDWPRREARKSGRKRFWPANRRPTTFRSAASSCRSSWRSKPTASRCGRSRWVSILPWNWSRSRRAACPLPGCRRRISGDKSRQATIETPAGAAGRRRETCGCERLPRSTMAGSWKLPRHRRCGRRLSVEHDSPLGPVAPVHRAAGNPRMPADRACRLEDVARASNWISRLWRPMPESMFPLRNVPRRCRRSAPRRPSSAKAK